MARALSGTGGPPDRQVSEVQRGRILRALAEVASERGIASTSVAHVVARAGVSRRTFYDIFEDRTECFLAVLERAVGEARAVAMPAWRGDDHWVGRIRAGLYALLGFFDEEPELAKACIVQSLAGGPAILARRSELLAELAGAVEVGHPGPHGGVSSPIVAEGVVGAVLAILHARLLEPDPEPLVGLSGQLLGLVLLPYLGPKAAAREAARPAVPIARVDPQTVDLPADPFEGLRMRITYRTLRVLAAIGERPGASNREVGQAAEIADPGQTSKLLGRLESLGLIENTGAGHSKGATNAWRLTPRGRGIRASVGGRANESPRRGAYHA